MVFISSSLKFSETHLQSAGRVWSCFFILSPKEFGVGIDFLPCDDSQNIFQFGAAHYEMSVSFLRWTSLSPACPCPEPTATTDFCFAFQKFRSVHTSYVTKRYHNMHMVMDLDFFI